MSLPSFQDNYNLLQTAHINQAKKTFGAFFEILHRHQGPIVIYLVESKFR